MSVEQAQDNQEPQSLLESLSPESLKDAADNQTKVSRAAIEALDQDTYEEIESAITAHIEARDAAKKTRTGANESAGS